ncbi:MAG: hypothetical protein ABFD14_03840 [Anaerolineaceae bacterium]
MTKTFIPFDSGAGASVFTAQWSKMMRTQFKDGVISNYLNDMQVYADSTGMQVKVKSGAGWIKGHYYENDLEEILAITAANATLARWDLVVLEVDWTKTDAQMIAKVITGTPAASPALPALTQNTSVWQIPLAKVVVGAAVSTIAAGNVSDLRIFANNFRGMEHWVVDKLRDVDTTTGVFTFRVPRLLNGYYLIRAMAFVETPGTTNNTTVQVINLTKYPSNDSLSTAISIASGSKVGTPGTINTSYDDVSTDDEIKIYVTANSTTKAKGLLVVLEFGLP